MVQSSTTADLIFPVGQLIDYLSSILPLLPGDVILTGTPSGVALGMTPPKYLRAGDQISTVVGDQTQHHTAIDPSAYGPPTPNRETDRPPASPIITKQKDSL